MTRMTGPDCAVMCILINTHTHKHGVALAGIRQLHCTEGVTSDQVRGTERSEGVGGKNGDEGGDEAGTEV